MSTPYPTPPWKLHGQAHVHAFLVPASALPATPAGFKPLVLAGRGIVIAGWVDYQGGSVLRYGELFAAVAGFVGRRPTGVVTHMWVDSEPSMAGGRELWGYPKELASFALEIAPGGTGVAHAGDVELARGSFRPWVTLPFRVGGRSGTTQPFEGGLKAVRMRVGGKPSIGGGSLVAPAESPLAFLRGARRLLGVGLQDFQVEFGTAEDGRGGTRTPDSLGVNEVL